MVTSTTSTVTTSNDNTIVIKNSKAAQIYSTLYEIYASDGKNEKNEELTSIIGEQSEDDIDNNRHAGNNDNEAKRSIIRELTKKEDTSAHQTLLLFIDSVHTSLTGNDSLLVEMERYIRTSMKKMIETKKFDDILSFITLSYSYFFDIISSGFTLDGEYKNMAKKVSAEFNILLEKQYFDKRRLMDVRDEADLLFYFEKIRKLLDDFLNRQEGKIGTSTSTSNSNGSPTDAQGLIREKLEKFRLLIEETKKAQSVEDILLG